MEWKLATKDKEVQRPQVHHEGYGDIFSDSKGVVHVDYLPDGTTMNGNITLTY